MSNTIRKDILPKLVGEIKTTTNDEEITALREKLLATLETISKLSQTAGKTIFKDVTASLDTILKQLGFRVKGRIGGTNGDKDVTDISKEDRIEKLLKDILNDIAKKQEDIQKELIQIEESNTSPKKGRTTKTKSAGEANSLANKLIAETQSGISTQKQNMQQLTKVTEQNLSATEKQTNLDTIGHSDEQIASNQAIEVDKDTLSMVSTDTSTGFNTDQNAAKMISHQISANRLLGEIKDLLSQAVSNIIKNPLNSNGGNNGGKYPPPENPSNDDNNVNGPYQSILAQIAQYLQNIDINVGNILQSTGFIPNRPPLATIKGQTATTHKVAKESFIDTTNYNRLHSETLSREIEQEREEAIKKATEQKYSIEKGKKERQAELEKEARNREAGRITTDKVELSNVITSEPTWLDKFQETFRNIFSSAPEVDKFMSMNDEERMRARARRKEIFGESDDDRLTSTGGVARARYKKSLYGWKSKQPEDDDIFQKVRLTKGFNRDETINTDAILQNLNKVLSGPEMFKAQTGGLFANLIGPPTLYLGQPSLEKSRAEAEAANTIMSGLRTDVLDLVQKVQGKEMTLKGMQDEGTAKFTKEGIITEDSSENAKKTFLDLEELKSVLSEVLAEVEAVDSVVESSDGNVHTIFQRLVFMMPELMKYNTIIQNVNAGFDKNGKALHFQSRTGEILNYSFQLMARNIGQMLKNWQMMLNPIAQIKKAFNDFTSYDVKWQRTMNVIKYNLRRIVRPMMEWIAQQVVNIIGLVNSLIKGIGKISGNSWDLFDQSAANAEKMREELEAAANVTAGFDELHDIGSDNTAAGDLLGDIYTPQWEGLNNFLEGIGEKIGTIISTVSHWNFWDWLKLAGLALTGFLALKWLINLFTGKTNPLQTVAKGFSFLEKAVGWALLIWAFTSFTKALTDFVECMKTASWEDIKKSLVMLGGALGEVAIAIITLQAVLKLLGSNWLSSLGIAAIVTSFALLTAAFAYFFDTIKDISSDQLMTSLGALAVGLALVGAAITALLLVLTAVISTGIGAVAIAALAAILVAISAVIASMALFVTAVGTYSDQLIAVIKTTGETINSIIQTIAQSISLVVTTVVFGIAVIIQTVGNTIANIIMGVAEAIQAVLEPILDFIEDIIENITDLAETIVHEVGETIRTIIETVGKVITDIITSIIDAVPTLLNAILNFCNKIGPAIENSADAIMRTITKVINFTVSAIEYLVNLVVGGVNQIISAINSISQYVGINIPRVPEVSISRFVPKYEKGTNYVPNDGLAYLHQGEAVIPKKYNQPYQPGTMSSEEKLYMSQMMNTMKSLDSTMKRGITVNGEFTQRGSDLVAVVNKTKSQTGADLLSNVAYAR